MYHELTFRIALRCETDVVIVGQWWDWHEEDQAAKETNEAVGLEVRMIRMTLVLSLHSLESRELTCRAVNVEPRG